MSNQSSKDKEPQSIFKPIKNPYGGYTTFEDVTRKLIEARDKVEKMARDVAVSKNVDPDYWFLVDGSEEFGRVIAFYDKERKRAALSFQPRVALKQTKQNSKEGRDE